MKKIGKNLFALSIIALLAGCTNKPATKPSFDWNNIYKTDDVFPYEVNSDSDLQKAKYGYEANNLSQGLNFWYYGSYDNGTFKEFSLNKGKFSSGKSYFDGAKIHIENSSLARKFVVQKSGKFILMALETMAFWVEK